MNGKHVTVARFKNANTKILDEGYIQAIGKELFAYADAQKPEGEQRVFIFDMSNVGYMSTAAFGKLITLDKKINAREGDAWIIANPGEIIDTFKITRLDKVFDIRQSEDEVGINDIIEGKGIMLGKEPITEQSPHERGKANSTPGPRAIPRAKSES